MAKGNPRDPLWRRHLRQQRRSGLTVRDYCAQWRLAGRIRIFQIRLKQDIF